MAPPDTFANYPLPIEGPAVDYEPRGPSKILVLKGLPLKLASAIVPHSSMLQRLSGSLLGLDMIHKIDGLDKIPGTSQANVTPLGPRRDMVEFGPDLLRPRFPHSTARYYSIADYHELYKSGQVTPLQVIKALLPLTKPSKGTTRPPYHDAWAAWLGKEYVAIEAARASTQRYAAGKPLSVLDGVPVGVKDDIAVEGYITQFGLKYDASAACFKDKEKSLWPIRKWQDAGAIVIGKLRLQQYGGDMSGLNVIHGTPTNHLNTAYCPGGSSSGPSSAVCSGIIPVAMATDGFGSVRGPASFCGVYALKPSHDRTVAMNCSSGTIGAMAANVADLIIAYRLMSQPDPECPIQGQFAVSVPPDPTAKKVLGVFGDWWKQADGCVSRACHAALDWFVAERSYELVDISIPFLTEALMASVVEMMFVIEQIFRHGGSNAADRFSLLEPPTKLTFAVTSAQASAVYLAKVNALRTLLMRHMAFLFQKHPGLIIVTPTTPMAGLPRCPIDEAYNKNDINLIFQIHVYTFLSSYTGTPSLSAPVAYVDPKQGVGKLPVGLMATGEWGSEEQLLSWAAEAEEYLHCFYPEGRRRPASWLDVMGLVRGAKGE
ncbi:hypothetical protein CDD82_6014 [Ophiocordyceps australis]|uniref:Amidase domain-containing protein n=1 Tax=Ophiocordyceps australis TaxID=1399860 RepID=A0A2C5ZMY9_9HYPO|nr:hypothetical protein CDD82_6014 [Ophiocordyceps australis]